MTKQDMKIKQLRFRNKESLRLAKKCELVRDIAMSD